MLINQQGQQLASVLDQSLQTPHVELQATAMISATGQTDGPTNIREKSTRLLSSSAEPLDPNMPNPALVPYGDAGAGPNDLISTFHQEALWSPQNGLPASLRQSPARPGRKALVITAGVLVSLLILLAVFTPQLLLKTRSGSLTSGQNGGTSSTQQIDSQGNSTSSQSASALSVIGAEASASASSYRVSCPTTPTLTFTGTIHVSPGPSGGTVSYSWLYSDQGQASIETISF